MSASSERTLTAARAAREAVVWEMEKNPDIFMIGEDIGGFGGVFGTAEGLAARFGAERVIDTPISETGFIGIATGAAMEGMRPIIELAYVDFIGVCYSALAFLAAKTHYMSGGQVKVPLVIQVGTGGGYNNAGQHSQTLHALMSHAPGLKVVAPSNAYDAKGLMHASIRDDNPVVYMMNKASAGIAFLGKPIPTSMSVVPREDYEIPFGQVRVTREGSDVTLVGVGWTVHQSLKAADVLAAEHGISAEVVDLRTLVPLDRDGIFESVSKTGRLVVSDEDYLSYGLTGEIVASVAERDPTVLKGPARRVAFPDISIPFSRPMENFAMPGHQRIVAAALEILN